MPINFATDRICARWRFPFARPHMPAATLLDHRISRAYDQLKHARRRGDANKTIYWLTAVNTLLDQKHDAMKTEHT